MTTKRFEHLRKKAEHNITNNLKRDLETTWTPDGVAFLCKKHGKEYKNNAKKKIEKYLLRYYTKKYREMEEKIGEIERAEEFTGELILTIEWTKSRMWGKNPKAYTNYGFEGTSISGCGYDKLSTATAEALNDDKRILKLLYAKADEILSKLPEEADEYDTYRSQLGYGSGYSILPYFEGGVGVSCHERILRGLGLKTEHAVSTQNTDVFFITKEVRDED